MSLTVQPAGELISPVPAQDLRQRLRARFRGGAIARDPVTVHLAVLIGFIVAGAAATWSRAADLFDHRLPATRDVGSYVWVLVGGRPGRAPGDPWLAG